MGSDKGWWYTPMAKNTHPDSFITAARNEIEKDFTGNFAMAVLKKGEVKAEHFYSSGKKVDRNTIFQVASLSKFVSAVGVMKLYEDGKVDLDTPIDQYLTRWKLPPGAFNNDLVTIKRLLSHTAGLTDELGYSGFISKDSVQTLEASLTKALDADEGKSGVVRVGIKPGINWKYSGGGFTLLQLLIEERSGESFDSYMRQHVFEPLGMMHSFYELPESENPGLSEFYSANGSLTQHRYYTSLAATSLYTSLADLELFFEFFKHGKEGVLNATSLREMQIPIGYKMGAPTYGLGTFLYTPLAEGRFIIGHDGMSTPPINTAFRLNPETGDGIIILETGHQNLATRLASDWVFANTGKVDNLLYLILLDQNLMLFTIGILILMVSLIITGIFRNKKNTKKHFGKIVHPLA